MSAQLCRWCSKTLDEHLPPEQPNRPVRRMPCSGWRERFSPRDESAADAKARHKIASGPACVLLSGGMDSTACLHWALDKYSAVRALGFDYGQPHRNAELIVAEQTAKRNGVAFEIIVLADTLHSGLLAAVPVHEDKPRALHQAFVPGRNLVFLSVALSRAARWWPEGSLSLVVGACLEDSAGFPDCTLPFLSAAEAALSAAVARRVSVAAPYCQTAKRDLVKSVMLAFPQGVADLQASWSCYAGPRSVRHLHTVRPAPRSVRTPRPRRQRFRPGDDRRRRQPRTAAEGRVMLLVSGNTKVVRGITDPRLGVLLRPGNGNRPTNKPWAVDNAAFTGFKEAPFLRLLERVRGIPGCLWVTAPDVVCDHAATLALFQEWGPRLSAMGFPVAFVAQNGLRLDEVPWEEIAALFIGGDDAFKLGAEAALAAVEAKRRGKLVHMGRVNSIKRLRIAHSFGCDSADGWTWTKYAPELRKALIALPEVEAQASLWPRFGGAHG